MPPTKFYRPLDRAQTITPGYLAGSASLNVVGGEVFGDPTPDRPLAVSVFLPTAVPTFQARYAVTGRSGNSLTGLTLLKGVDADLPPNSLVRATWSANHAEQLYEALAAAEQDIAGLQGDFGGFAVDSAVVHKDGPETINGAKTFAAKIVGSISGDADGQAGSVLNGVYTTGAYADPTWLTAVAASKVSGAPAGLLKGSGGSIATAVAGSDYVLPSGSIAGNAGTVTNGVYTTGSYANPAWIASLALSKVTGAPTGVLKWTGSAYAAAAGGVDFAAVAHTHAAGDITGVPAGLLKGDSGAVAAAVAGTDYVTPSGSISGNAGTVTNGVYTTGSYANPAWITSLAIGKVTGAPTGLLKYTGSAFAAAAAGTDYLAPSGSGSALTNLNAGALATGTVPTARLGSGTASASTFLRGDGTWVAVAGGGNDASALTTGTLPDARLSSNVPRLNQAAPFTAGVSAPTFTGAMFDAGGQVFNVLRYGAVGDGSTLNDAAFTAAIAAASAAGGGAVLVPCGVFCISASIRLPDNVGLVGVGLASEIRSTGLSSYIAVINFDTTNGNAGLFVRDLYINANRAGRSTVANSGMLASGTTTTVTLPASASASDSAYVNYGLYITGGTGSGQSRLITAYTGSTRTATVGTSAFAVAPDGTSTYEVRQEPNAAGLRFIASDANACRNVSLARVRVANVGGTTAGAGIQLMNCQFADVDACTVANTQRDGVDIWFNCQNVAMRGGSVTGAGDDCVAVNGEQTGHTGAVARFITISGVQVAQDPASQYGTGMRISAGEDVTVQGCTVNGSYGHGILVEGGYVSGYLLPSKRVNILGNSIKSAGNAATLGHGIALASNAGDLTQEFVQGVNISGNAVAGFWGNGIQAATPANVTNNTIVGGNGAASAGINIPSRFVNATGNHLSYCPGNGIVATNEKINVTNNILREIGVNNGGQSYILIGGGTNRVTVSGNWIFRGTGATGSFGIRLATGTGSENSVTNNTVQGFTATNAFSSAATGANTFLGNYAGPTAPAETLTASGAASTAIVLTTLSMAATGQTVTLAAGGAVGMPKKFVCTNANAPAISFGTNQYRSGTTTGSSVTMTNGQVLSLVWDGAQWVNQGEAASVDAANVFGTLPVAKGGTGGADAPTARSNLGLVIGTNVLAPNGNGSGLTNIVAATIAPLAEASAPSNGLFVSASTGRPSWKDTGGVVYPVVGTLFSQVADGDTRNSTAELSLLNAAGARGSATLPANLQAGTIVRITLKGNFTTQGVGTPGNFTVKIKLGANTILTTPATAYTGSLSGAYWQVDAEISVASPGAAGSIRPWATGLRQSSGTATLPTRFGTPTAPVAVDMSAPLAIDVTSQNTTLDPVIGLVCTNATIAIS